MNKQSINIKPHPYTIYTYLSRFLYFLIIPVLQQLLFSPETLLGKISSTLINILIIIALVVIAVYQYKSIHLQLHREALLYEKGIFVNRTTVTQYNNICSVFIQGSILPKLFGSVRMLIDTNSIADKKPLSIYTTRKNAKTITTSFWQQTNSKCLLKLASYKTLLMALTRTSVFTGLLILAPFINKIGKVLGQEYSDRLYSSMDLTSYLMIFGLPPAMAYLAGIFLIGYCISVIIQAFRYSNFTLQKQGDKIFITRGFISTSGFITSIKNISAITIKQNLFMIILRHYSTYIESIHNSKRKNTDGSMLVPIGSKALTVDIIKQLYPFSEYHTCFKPQRKSIKSYLYLPLTFLGLILAVSIYMYFSNIDRSFISIYLLFFVPLSIIWLWFRIIAFNHCCVCIGDKTAKICTYKGLTLQTTILPAKNIELTVIKQSVFQRIFGTYNLGVFIRTNKGKVLYVKHLAFHDACHL
ncbi:MAG TPA: PH domain-containing protein [Clostridiales bacterium]|nr:PH domain-containing protein [Clostridiales bacterium]